jgi:hypothetical protein
LEGRAGPYGPDRPRRLVIATVDPATLPEAATWYLATTLPLAEADLAEVVRLYGLRTWVEQAYKQVKHSLGWSQYQVRADRAMRRHWALVQCAFAFCWWAETRTPTATMPEDSGGAEGAAPPGERGEKGGAGDDAPLAPAVALLAAGAAAGAGLAGTSHAPVALLARVDGPPAATAPAGPPGLGASRLPPPPL